MGEGSAETRIDPVLEVPQEDGPALSPPAMHDEVEIELAFWDSIKESGSIVELEAYLERYPNGPFTVLAQTRREALIAAESDASSTRADEEVLAVELAFWEAAKDSGNCNELEAYIDRYPNGEFVELAKARVESLCETARNPEGALNEEVTEGELTFWNSIKDSGNPDMFRAYLNKYTDGTFAELARINIDAEVP